MSARAGRAAAAAAGLTALVALVATALFLTQGSPTTQLAGEITEGGLLAAAICAAVFGLGTVLVAWQEPRHPILLPLVVTSALWSTSQLSDLYVRVGLDAADPWPGMTFALWYLLRFTALIGVGLAWLLCTFPDGRFAPGRWGLAARLGVGLMLAQVLLYVVTPFSVVDPDFRAPPGVDLDPTTIPALGEVLGEAGGVFRLVLVGALLGPMGSVVARYRRSSGLERDRMRWLAWSVLAAAVVNTLWLLTGLEDDVLLVITFTLPVLAIVVGVVRPQVVAVDRLLSATAVYGALSVLIVGLDLVALSTLTSLVGDRLGQREVVLTVLLVTGLLYNPLRQALTVWVRRWMLGRRDEPYDVVARLAGELERADDGGSQLSAVAAAVARAFGIGYVRVEVEHDGSWLVAEHGRRPGEERQLPITYQGSEVGRLVLPAGGIRGRLSPRDERLLGDLVRQAAIAARATQLAELLQGHREQLVLAREEELRRVRRDLHDGLGPALGGAVFQLESARLLATRDPSAADRSLAATGAHLAEVLREVRRLVDDLRPPLLDELGLPAALEELVALVVPGGPAVRLAVASLPPLPAAVEVAAYRIVGEALTNVVRHAQARTCRVRLAVAEAPRGGSHLVVEVLDDGRGVAPGTAAGIGLGSLRERAAELGGQTEVACPPEGGTRVRATIPVGPPPEPPPEPANTAAPVPTPVSTPVPEPAGGTRP